MTSERPGAPLLPARLRAQPPGWTTWADVVVVGSGIAGLTAALRLRSTLDERLGPQPAGARGPRVLVVTKDVLDAGSTRWAQGGIAAALGPGDTPAQHEADTLVAGAGGCDPEAVRALVEEGPEAVRELIALGTVFDQGDDGELALTREGGHHRDRIAHAGGDATGAEISRALIAAVRAAPEIEVVEHALALDLMLDGPPGEGAVAGVTLHVMGEGQRDGVGAVRCRAVVLASGGLGQVFAQTTNPGVATGDGVALALRAGARLRDLEFVQFHPTMLHLGADASGQQPLVSEAVRGEGAVLLDHDGSRVMEGVHPQADLAPRDLVAKAITRRMRAGGHDHVWLDGRHLGAERWQRRFPTILRVAREHGIDPVVDLLPVAPACHYASGGVAVDLAGRTDVLGLYATGEVACTGVHGANRLASNSLLEGLVFSRRIAEVLPAELGGWRTPVADRRPEGLVGGEHRDELQRTMTARAGVLRSATGLAGAAADLADLAGRATRPDRAAAEPGAAAWETTNLLTVATGLVAAALRREETRGSHWREDHPDRDDARWSGHLDLQLDLQLDPQLDPQPDPGGSRLVVDLVRTRPSDTLAGAAS